MGAFLVGRRAAAGPAIAAAALVLLATNPLQLADLSLQLSLASVVGIALCARGIGPSAAPAAGGLARRALAWLWRFVAATIAATAATAPLVAHHFGEVAPLSPLGNLALVPIVELAVVPIGLLGAIAGAIWPPLGTVPLAAAGLAARAALAAADAFRVHAPLWPCRAPNCAGDGGPHCRRVPGARRGAAGGPGAGCRRSRRSRRRAGDRQPDRARLFGVTRAI